MALSWGLGPIISAAVVTAIVQIEAAIDRPVTGAVKVTESFEHRSPDINDLLETSLVDSSDLEPLVISLVY